MIRSLVVAAWASVLALAAIISPLAAAPSTPRAPSGGSWMVAGPFAVERGSILEDGLDRDYLLASGIGASGEARAAPLRIQESGSGQWREAEGDLGVDFAALFGGGSYSVAYAYREINSRKAGPAVLRIRSDDGVKVWINGLLVLGHHVRRSLSTEEDPVLVSLLEGKNRLLVKVEQAEGEWGFSLKLGSLEEETAAAKAPTSLVVCPDLDSAPSGALLEGSLLAQPAAVPKGRAELRLADASGRLLAKTEAGISGRFSLKLPSGLSGIAYLSAIGLGPHSRIAAPRRPIVIGDPSALARAAAATARAAAKASTSPGASGPPLPDPASTFEFLARLLEGGYPAKLGGFEAGIEACEEIEALATPRKAGAQPAAAKQAGARLASPLAGLLRCAYRCGLDGSIQPYALYVPEGYSPSKSYGLVVALHGAGGGDYDMASGLASASPQDMIILAPYGRGDLGWTGLAERDVLDSMDSICASYAIDPDRVYLMGRSMGGYGAWRLGQLYAPRFAAVASFAGWTAGLCLENLAGTPLLAVHGDADRTVPYQSEASAVSRLKDMGADARLDLLAGVGHEAFGAWTAGTGPSRLLDWLRGKRRQSWPAAIKIRASGQRYGAGPWAGILGFVHPMELGELDARIVDQRHIAVDTDNVSAFCLDLRHPSLAKTGRILILADGVNLTADANSGKASFELASNGRFKAAKGQTTETAVNSGQGFAALFDLPLRIVYGSGKRAKTEANAAVAAALADWTSDGERSVGGQDAAFPVLQDRDADLAADGALLLVGTPGDNRLIAAIADRLPIKIDGKKIVMPSAANGAKNDGAKAYGAGLLLVCPNPESPGRLLGIAMLPDSKDRKGGYDRLKFAKDIVRSLRDYQARGDAGLSKVADAMILDEDGKTIWAGCFDRRWANLTRVGP